MRYLGSTPAECDVIGNLLNLNSRATLLRLCSIEVVIGDVLSVLVPSIKCLCLPERFHSLLPSLPCYVLLHHLIRRTFPLLTTMKFPHISTLQQSSIAYSPPLPACIRTHQQSTSYFSQGISQQFLFSDGAPQARSCFRSHHWGKCLFPRSSLGSVVPLVELAQRSPGF